MATKPEFLTFVIVHSHGEAHLHRLLGLCIFGGLASGISAPHSLTSCGLGRQSQLQARQKLTKCVCVCVCRSHVQAR